MISSVENDLQRLNPLVHEKGRFVILHSLVEGGPSEFVFLARLTGLPTGTISNHIHKLEDAGLVEVEKEFVRRRPKTTVNITEAGKAAVDEHWRQLQQLKDEVRRFSGDLGAAS